MNYTNSFSFWQSDYPFEKCLWENKLPKALFRMSSVLDNSRKPDHSVVFID